MSAEIILLIGLGAAAGFAIAPRMLRQSAVEEMGLLLENGSSESLLRSGWGEDDFPEFFSTDWEGSGREFYKRLARNLRGPKYGASRKLLVRLIRIEDERQAAKAAGDQKGDERYRERTLALLAGYRGKGGFESILSAFIEKRYEERKDGIRG